jgi:hypothetical protein
MISDAQECSSREREVSSDFEKNVFSRVTRTNNCLYLCAHGPRFDFLSTYILSFLPSPFDFQWQHKLRIAPKLGGYRFSLYIVMYSGLRAVKSSLLPGWAVSMQMIFRLKLSWLQFFEPQPNKNAVQVISAESR